MMADKSPVKKYQLDQVKADVQVLQKIVERLVQAVDLEDIEEE